MGQVEQVLPVSKSSHDTWVPLPLLCFTAVMDQFALRTRTKTAGEVIVPSSSGRGECGKEGRPLDKAHGFRNGWNFGPQHSWSYWSMAHTYLRCNVNQ